MNYVIIGNSAAAVGAIEGIREIDREGKITVISDEPYHTYSRPLISYWLAGKVTEDNMVYRDKNFYEANGVTAVLGTRAEQIDFNGKKVKLAGGKEIPYDKLLIASGGRPVIPQMEGLDKKGVFSFIKFDDVKEIREAVAAGKKKAVVIGAGLIGSKAAEALVKLGIDVTVVEYADRILPNILDREAASLVQKYLEGYGMKFELNTTVTKILGDSAVTGVALNSGSDLECDIVVVAVGVRPNIELVNDSAVKVNRGILVNDRIETSIPGVYAAGDVSEGYLLVHEVTSVLPILPNAYLQGEVAGRNMAGTDTVFAGGLTMNAIGFGEMPMLTAGIINPESDRFEVLVNADFEKNFYRKVVLRDNRVVGFICLGRIDRAGILTGLMKDKIDVSGFKSKLLSPDFGYVHFPIEFRKNKLDGGAA